MNNETQRPTTRVQVPEFLEIDRDAELRELVANAAPERLWAEPNTQIPASFGLWAAVSVQPEHGTNLVEYVRAYLMADRPWEDAHAVLVAEAEREVDAMRLRLEQANGRLWQIRGMKPPAVESK